jgi:CRP-like cAMP-binding protein/SAM-dependent methyltransferase/GNAT superfamily N-acetyltransferase
MNIHVIRSKTPNDRKNVYRFLYDIWSKEFFRSMDGMNHEYRFFEDELDQTAQHFIAVDQTGQILGCVRGNNLKKSTLPALLHNHLQISKLTRVFDEHEICYGSHFAVAPNARGKTVASLLIKALYRYCLRENLTIGLSYCALHYISFYYQLGYRPYTTNFRIDSGIRVPILHCIQDKSYLKSIKSPLLRLCPITEDDRGATAAKLRSLFPGFRTPGFSRVENHHLWARLAYASPSNADSKNNALLADLSENDRKLVCRHGSEIVFSQGEYVYKRGETEQGMGLLLSGSLGIEISFREIRRIVNVVLPGEPFGEIHSIDNGYRTTNLVAMEESKAILFPADLIEQVSSRDSQLGLKLTTRLLKTVASRFANFSDVAAYAAESIVDKIDNKTQVTGQPTDHQKINSRVNSYQFDSLGDQEGEFKRLITQATIGEDIEFSVLENIGLCDGTRVLDLGSGPGVTSLLISKRFPSSLVSGVEPDDQLREKANVLISSQGFSNRCHFIKGAGDRIPLETGAIDFSYARLLFQHLPNPKEVLMEMRRVTRTNGIVVVLDVDDASNIIHPAPPGLKELEESIAKAQAKAGGDRYVGRKLHGYMHEIGLIDAAVEHIPITANALGREMFFAIVYSFKRQVLERDGKLNEQSSRIFNELEEYILKPSTFAMTTVFVAHGIVP